MSVTMQTAKQQQIIQSPVSRKAYTSDLSDAAWETIASMLVLPEGGRPRTTNMRKVFNAIYYQAKFGCPCVDFLHEQKVDDKTQRPKVEYRKRRKNQKCYPYCPNYDGLSYEAAVITAVKGSNAPRNSSPWPYQPPATISLE